MSRVLSRIAMTLSLLLATLWWSAGPTHQAHASIATGTCGSRGFQICFPIPVRDCTDGVTTNPGTLRAALKLAQQLAATADAAGSSDKPTIIFKCSGTITLSSTLTLIQGPVPGLSSWGFTIDGAGQKVTLSGGGAVPVFAVNYGVNAAVKNLTIAQGSPNGIANGGTLSVVNSTVSGNTGPGMSNSGTLSVVNSTVSGNAGPGIGNTGTLDVVNSTFSGNAGTGGAGGIYNQGTAAVTNSILSGNGSNCSGAITDNGDNLADDGTCNFKPITNSLVVSTAALRLGSPADNGGSTRTIALLPGSAAIDFAPCRQFTDQRGSHRPDPGDTRCDSGAYESSTAGAATIPLGSCDQTSLANAITAAGAGGLVQFTQDCTITLSSPITPSQDVTIDGNGHRVTLSGGDAVPVIVVSQRVTAVLNDLTITKGHPGGTFATDSGGIYNEGNLTVSNSTVSDNLTFVPLGAGGILNGGTLTVSNSTFSGNRSGAVTGLGGGISNYGTTTVSNSTFSGNGGGGLLNNSGTITVTNSIFSGNGLSVTGDASDCATFQAGAIIDNGGNLADDASCAFTQSSSKNGATGLNLGSLADNGGPTQTVALLPGSAARDVLPAVSCVDPQGFPLAADQRGFPRLDEGESTCDSGAFESNPPRTSGITPNTAPQHSGFSITVSGTDFSAGSVVYLGTAAAPTHFVSSTQLAADVPATLSADTALVTVVNHDGGAAATSNPQLLFLTNSGAGLLVPPSIGSGVNPWVGAINASVSAQGSGFVALALYAQNPGGPYFANSAGPFDVYVAPGNTFTSVTITSCINPLSIGAMPKPPPSCSGGTAGHGSAPPISTTSISPAA